jgi:hypothetical protein
MKRLICLAIFACLAMNCEAQVRGGIADVSILDRDSGAMLEPHYYRGEYWVAGRPGARYAIEIHNRLGLRVMAVTSVDGVNVVSGATAALDQTGYVFDAGESYQITGWRKTDAEVAAFTFTASPNSYADRTGRPANVGVIGVAIFRERQPQPVYAPPTIGEMPLPSPHAQPPSATDSAAKNQSMAMAGSVAAAARAANSASIAVPSPAPAPKLGTGHGEREYSYVNRTEFARLQSQPNEVIRIRYDSLDNLFAMGIVRRPRPVLPTVNPFPASPAPDYVPDPQG